MEKQFYLRIDIRIANSDGKREGEIKMHLSENDIEELAVAECAFDGGTGKIKEAYG